MPKIRIGLSTDFNLAGEQVGIGTTNPTARVDVAGQILAKNTGGSGGVSTYREYQGFHQTQSNVSHKVTIDATTAGNLNSLSGELRIDGDVTIAPDTSVTSGKIDSLTATDKFAVPLGETNNRENTPEAGTTRFNQDFGTLEFFDGVNWKTVNSYSRGGAAGRGVFAGGFSNPLYHSIISYIQIPTTGNALNFGDLTTNAGFAPAVSNGKRAVWGSRYTGSGNNTMDYVTIPSQGNAIDFGNSTGSLWSRGGLSSSTRGIFFGGNPASDVIEYIEIATLGDALDFGDIMSSRRDAAGLASATRGILSGGQPGIGADYTRIESITIASKGNSIRFGESTMGSMGMAGASNSTRGIFAGGTTVPTLDGNNTIEFVTISSEGNAVDFGDLTQKTYRFNAMSTGTRVVFAHGTTGPSGTGLLNTMDYINISSQGNATDFGDKIFAYGEYSGSGTSDSHGGLGGF